MPSKASSSAGAATRLCCGRLWPSSGWLMLLALMAIALLLHVSMQQQQPVRAEEYSSGGGPPGSAALAVPPGSNGLAHRLRSSLRGIASTAKLKGDVLLYRLKHSRLADKLRGKGRPPNAAGEEDEEDDAAAEEPIGDEEADAEEDTASPQLHRLSDMTLVLSRAREAEEAGDFADAEIAALPPSVLLPTPAQCAKIVADHVAGRPAAQPGEALHPAPAKDTLSGVLSAPLLVPPPPAANSLFSGLVIATRFWASSPADLPNLRAFVERSLGQAERVLIALNVDADRADTLGFVEALELPRERLRVVPVTPWIGVSPALNALSLTASSLNATRILFASVEVSLTREQVQALAHEMDAQPDQLVVGAVLDGHLFEETKPQQTTSRLSGDEEDEEIPDGTSHAIDGHNAPWNTAALWHLPSLLQTGFLTVSDGLPKGVHHFGQEEVPTINLLQGLARAAHHMETHLRDAESSGPQAADAAAVAALDVHRWRVTLLHVGDVSWSHSFSSSIATAAARNEWHARKMASKLSRAAHHMSVLGGGLRPGRVEHRVARVHKHSAAVLAEAQEAETRPLATAQQDMARDIAAARRSAIAGAGEAAAPLVDAGASRLSSARSATKAPVEFAVSAAYNAVESVNTPATPLPAASDGAVRRLPRPVLLPARAPAPPTAAAAAGAASAFLADRAFSPHAHEGDERMDVKIRRGIPIGRL